ncbi:MAG: SPASM domain-containing protein [Acidobacteriota bacterium]|nr:SPASM domain-containing protein [Acidobacteriota bacterium]
MKLQSCGGNQDWPGGPDEAGAEPAVREHIWPTLEVEWGGLRRPGALSPAEWADVAGQAAALGARRFIIRDRGGALADPEIWTLLRRIRSLGGRFVVITDGRRLNRAAAGELAGLGGHVILRWPSGRPAPLSRDRWPSGLDLLASAGYPRPGLVLGIRIPASLGGPETDKLWRWALRRGFLPSLERTWRADGRSFRLEPPRLPEELRRLTRRLGVFPDLFGCERVRTSLAVTSEGEVKPCLGFGSKLGNVRSAALTKIVADNPLLAGLRNAKMSVKGFCRICPSLTACSGCRALAGLREGDPLAPDQDCWEKIIPVGNVHTVDADHRLPHRGPMRFLRGTARLDDEKITLQMRIPRGSVLARADGTVVPLLLIEMLAQLCAVHRAHTLGKMDGSQVHGYLVGMDHVRFRKPVAAGDMVRLVAWNTLEMNEINRVEGEVLRDGAWVARAEMTLFKAESWLPPEAEAACPAPPETERPPVFPPGASDRMGRGIVRAVKSLQADGEGAWRARLRFDPDFIGFNGHFPGHPIVPGVALIYAGFLLATAALERDLVFRSIKRARFMKPVRPGVPLECQIRISRPAGAAGITVAAKILLGGETAAKYEFSADTAGGRG